MEIGGEPSNSERGVSEREDDLGEGGLDARIRSQELNGYFLFENILP